MGVVGSVLLMFYLFGLQLVSKSKLGSLFLELGKLVFVFGHLLEGGLDELALHVTDGDGELVDLKGKFIKPEMFFLQREVILRDLQINELTISVSDMKGK